MRIYLNNIRRHWPIERQERVLDEHVPDWRDGSVYRDILPPRKRMGHGPADLKQRADMLRPTRRGSGQQVHVATLAVLAWTVTDLFSALAALAARGDTLVSAAESVTVLPEAGASAINVAADAFQSALHKAEGVGPSKGARVSAERREAEAKAKCETIRPYWHLPSKDHPTRTLCAEAGVSRATAFHHLRDRRIVQREYEERMKRTEINRKRRKSNAEHS